MLNYNTRSLDASRFAPTVEEPCFVFFHELGEKTSTSVVVLNKYCFILTRLPTPPEAGN